MKKAFTLIELIVVIIVVGILASIGADIFTNMYQNYIQISNIHDLESKTKNVSEIVAKRLEYSIKETVAATTANPNSNTVNSMNVVSIDDLNKSDDDPTIGLVWFARDYDMEKNSSRSNFMRVNVADNRIHVPTGAIEETDRNHVLIVPDVINQYTDFATFYRDVDANNSLRNADFRNEEVNGTRAGVSVDLNTTGSVMSAGVNKFYLSDTIHRLNTINATFPTNAQGNRYLKGDGTDLVTYDLALFSCNTNGTNCTNVIIEKDISSFRFRRVGISGLILKICMVDRVLTYESGGRNYLYEICKTRVVQ